MQPLPEEIDFNTSTICNITEDEDGQDSSEEDSDDPRTVKRSALTSEPTSKKKGSTKEVPLHSGARLTGNTVEDETKTAANPNKITTTKVPKTVTAVETANASTNAALQYPVTTLISPALHIRETPSSALTLAPNLSVTTSALNSATLV